MIGSGKKNFACAEMRNRPTSAADRLEGDAAAMSS